MNTNKCFSLSRFWTLLKWQWLLEKRSFFLKVVMLSVIYFLYIFLSLGKNTFYRNPAFWETNFFFLITPTLIFIAGLSFPFLRSKEGTFEYSMLPATSFEKYMAEFIFRCIMIWVVSTILFIIMAEASYILIKVIKPTSNAEPFNIKYMETEQSKIAISLFYIALAQSVAFAGAVVFRQQALLKTIGIIALFLFLMFQITLFRGFLMPKGQYNSTIQDIIKESAIIPVIIMAVTLITSYLFSYFKLKEKQIA